MLSLLSLAKSLPLLPWRAVQNHINGHFLSIAYASVSLSRGPTVLLSTAIDKSQRQCPRGTAQLLSAALVDAGGTAVQQEVLLLQNFLQVHCFKLDGHTVDSSMVEDLSDFSAGILVPGVLLVLDVQGSDDLPTYQLPDVHVMHTADSRHARELAHYKRQEQTTAKSEGWNRSLESREGPVCLIMPTKTVCLSQPTARRAALESPFSHNHPSL